MNTQDPNSPDIGGLEESYFSEGELSVEDVAQMQAFEAASQGQPEEGAALKDDTTEARAAIPPGPLPVPIPLPILRRPVSGRYLSQNAVWRLELRVDVDGRRPMRRVSGDFYRVSGATTTYFGSFIVDSPAISVTSSLVTITGLGRYTYATGFPRIRLTIRRVPLLAPPAPATLQFFTPTNAPGATYSARFVSRFFRTVQLEQDLVPQVAQFQNYNTGSLPSGGSARNLTVLESFAEAGVEMLASGTPNTIAGGTGSNGTWSNAELHAAMQTHFSLWQDVPQWKVWLLHARLHDIGPGLLGIMFDQQGRQRQGAGVFYQSLAGQTADRLRKQLYTCVHELGHCFNLFHSFHKTFMTPPLPNRPAALSWMNYPQSFPGGENAFWAAFPFQFDDLEVVHLRHAFRDNIIIGGNPFGTGAALTEDGRSNPVEDNSGLRLELRAPRSFALGEPPVVEIKLAAAGERERRVHSFIHPNMGFVQIAIRKPGGQIVTYEPLMHHCVADLTTVVGDEQPAIYESAYLGYGKGGFYFDQSGFYQLRATYFALDGSEVLSNVLTLRVRSPLTAEEEEIADLYFGEEQGTLFYLLGSDSESLARGNAALDAVLDKHGDHPLAVYARLAKGFNEAREFKRIDPADNTLDFRPPKEEGIKLLSSVVKDCERGVGVDNITLNQTLRRIARAQKERGDDRAAANTAARMVKVFADKNLNPFVMAQIESQAAEIAPEAVPAAEARVKGKAGTPASRTRPAAKAGRRGR
jgi:hypothetical protein